MILRLRFPQLLLLLQQLLLLLLFINFSVVPIDAFANNNNNNNNNNNIQQQQQQQQQQQSQKRSTAAAAAAAVSSSSSSASSLVRASVRASASVRLIEEDDDSLSLSSSKNDDISNNDSDSDDKDKDSIIDYSSSRRRWMYQTQQKFATTAAAAALTVVVALPSLTKAAYGSSSVEEEKEDSTTTTTTTTTRNTSTRNNNSNTKIGVVTDKVYVDIAGLGIQSESSESSAEISQTQRIVFGLFGNDSPNSVTKIKQLFNSKVGLPAECKPLKKDFLIQREQLEANKVYRSCIEGVESNNNVNYLYSQIWRIIQNDRIDFGSVSGKFISREFPTWNENGNDNENENEDNNNTGGNGESDGFANTAKKITEYTSQPTIHYLMAVRRGNDSGFGFTVFPTENLMNNQDFLDNYIVIGKVCESTDSIIQQINNVSVVATSKKINYGGIIVGGKNKKNAPDKSCRYGGPMYCNENKPLKKLTMFRTGIESMDAVLYL